MKIVDTKVNMQPLLKEKSFQCLEPFDNIVVYQNMDGFKERKS